MTIDEKVSNIKERIKILESLIEVGGDEISSQKVRDRFLEEKYQQLNNAYDQLKLYDSDNNYS